MKKAVLLLAILLTSCEKKEMATEQESLLDFEFISNMPCDHYQRYTVSNTDDGHTIESEVNYYFHRNDTIMSHDFITLEKNRKGDIVFYMSAEASGAYSYDGNNWEGEMRYEFYTNPGSGQIDRKSFGIYENGEM